jgi:hypothetical protein
VGKEQGETHDGGDYNPVLEVLDTECHLTKNAVDRDNNGEGEGVEVGDGCPEGANNVDQKVLKALAEC